MYDPKICRQAIDAERGHALSAVASDNSPGRDSYMGKLPNCDCPSCEPGAWPANIQDQVDEYAENNSPGTIPVDE